MMVPGHLVARIIGAGGQTIKALMEKFGVKMVIIQDSSDFKKGKPLRITGPPDKIRAAKRRIEQVISEELMGGYGYSIVYGGGGQVVGEFVGGSYEMMVPGHLVARIIGTGGQTIKALMGETGVKMVIIQDSSDFKKEKPLRITGPPDKIRAAKRRVEQVISEEQEKMGGYNIAFKLSDESWSRCYNIVYKLSDESWNKFCKWRSYGGQSESNLRELENVTGATVDKMDYREQMISVSGCQRALNKLVDTLKKILQGNFGIV